MNPENASEMRPPLRPGSTGNDAPAASHDAATAQPSVEQHELAALLREIRDEVRDRLPLPAKPPSRGLHLHEWVKAAEPWGILLAVIGLFLALITFWIDYRDRVEERAVRAWQLLTTEAPGNSGKREALEYLNREDGLLCGSRGTCLIRLKEKTLLTGIDLSVAQGEPGTFLLFADLTGAILSYANLAGAELVEANLAGTNLFNSNLGGANLFVANLAGANLTEANLAEADLVNTNLAGADLTGADLTGASLSGTNLAGANLDGANLTSTHICDATMPDESRCDRDCNPAGACPWLGRTE